MKNKSSVKWVGNNLIKTITVIHKTDEGKETEVSGSFAVCYSEAQSDEIKSAEDVCNMLTGIEWSPDTIYRCAVESATRKAQAILRRVGKLPSDWTPDMEMERSRRTFNEIMQEKARQWDADGMSDAEIVGMLRGGNTDNK